MRINYHLSKIISTIASRGELKEHFTAHSDKATSTCITQRYESGIDENTIQQRSGNRSTSSLRVYSRSETNKLTIKAESSIAKASSGIKFSAQSKETQNEESSFNVAGPSTKLIRIEANGENNVITFSFV